MKKIYKLLFFCFCTINFGLHAQTTIISPTGAGGFELGNDFASNGWSLENYSSNNANKWFVGSAGIPSAGINSAYISNNVSGTTYDYLITSASRVMFWRDVTFPAGETSITLTFKIKVTGEVNYDDISVFIQNGATVPNTSTQPAASGNIAPSISNTTNLGTFSVQTPASTYVTKSIIISPADAGNATVATTRRIIFYWENDGSGGVQPPVSIDEISLVSSLPPPPPINNECSTATALTVNPDFNCGSSSNGTTVGATQSTGTTPTCNATGINDDVWYTFTSTGTNHQVKITGATNTTAAQVYSGPCNALVTVMCTSTTSGALTMNLTGLTASTIYTIRVYTTVATFGVTSNFTICVGTPPPPPVNDICSGAINLTMNSNCIFQNYSTSGATDNNETGDCTGGTETAVWFKFTATNSAAIVTVDGAVGFDAVIGALTACGSTTIPTGGGCTDNTLDGEIETLTLTGLTIGNTYYIQVYDYQGDVLPTSTFDICVSLPPLPPANDECSAAATLIVNSDLNCGNITNGTTVSATQSTGTTPTCNATGINDDVWYSFTSTSTTHQIAVTGATSPTAVQVYSGPCNTLITLMCSSTTSGSLTMTLTGLTTSTIYRIRVYTTVATVGVTSNFTICVGTPPAPPANDECINATNVPVTNGLATQPVSGTMLGATASTGTFSSMCNTYSNTLDVWYKVTVPASGSLFLETFVTGGTTNSNNDYSFQVYSGTCGALTYVNCNEDGGLYGVPTAFMPSLALSGRTPSEVLYIRLRKTTAATQNTFTIAAFDPSVLIPLAPTSCNTGVIDITVANGNAYRFVPLLDLSGNLVGELFAYGQNLGTVSSAANIHTGTVRKDAKNISYLNRDFNINVQNQPTTPVDMYLYFTNSELLALQAADPSITLANLNTTKTSNTCGTAPSTGGVLLTNYDDILRSDNSHGVAYSVPSFSSFYLHGGLVPLPVNLHSFDAKAVAKKMVELTWKVTEEVDVVEYIVQRSNDNKNWISIGAVNASQKSLYNFRDNNPLQGPNYYRLKINDLNASSTFSEIRTVNFLSTGNMSVYPNPANDLIFVNGVEDKNVVVSIYNEVGQIVSKNVSNGIQIGTGGIDISKLLPGAYSIQVKSDSNITTLRFVKS